MPPEAGSLTLREALERWCDPDLVEAVRAEERTFIPYALDQVHHRIQLTPRSERRQPTSVSWMVETDYTFLSAAWRDLESDLRQRISHGQIHLRGTQSKPQRRTEPEDIPGAWAGDALFDFAAGAIGFGDYRFTAVICARQPFETAGSGVPASASATPTASGPSPLRPEDVSALSDDTILALLKEHARRVIESPDARLIAPGKVSFLPIIKRKMEHRASRDELLPRLSDEAAVLEAWIASKIEHHQVPTASTIAKVLGSNYAALRARSTAAI